jgi:MGT family glycosyltransferase
MKIVFFCIPAHGHTNPTLGVVKELIKDNHEVYYYSYEVMRTKIESTGAKFIACDQYDPQTQLTQEDKNKIAKDIVFSTNLIVDMTLRLDDAILNDMKIIKPDVIVADSMAFWGKLIAKKLNIPFISSTTTFAFNKYSAKVMKNEGPGLFQIIRSMPKINKSLKRLRKKGYEVKSILDIVANSNDTSTIVYTSQMFQPFSETFSNCYAFVGPIIQDTSVSLEKLNIPTVYISLGTVNNNNKIFYRHCFEELKNENLRIIMSVGESINIENIGEIPKNFIVKKHVDQISVLQVTDVFITHCGMNSVSEALYFGIPLVLFPQTTEQYGVASRVKELNAGMFLENNHIKDTVLTVLNNQSFKDNALKISDSFKKCGGAKEAAQFIVNKSCNNR